MNASLRTFVRERAGNRCEYCRLHQDDEPYLPFHIEHIVARQHAGADLAHNLAVACNHCNSCKGPNLTGIDPRTRKIVHLFHPRRHKWTRHFRWAGPILIGRTAIGRTTISVLQINHADSMNLRQELMDAGVILST
jgi:hypothetical protein